MDRRLVGRRLAELRVVAGLSQQAVADHLRIPQPNYARWETGKMLLPAMHVPELAALFNVQVDAFFEAPSTDPPKPPAPDAPKRGRRAKGE